MNLINNIDLKYICTVIGNLSGVPIRIFDKDEQIFFHSPVLLIKDPLTVYKDTIWKIDSHIGYFITRHFNYYGVVNNNDIKIIIGPTRQTQNTSQELRELAFKADVPEEDIDDFISSMKGIVRMPLNSVLQMLCTINYILNNEKLELKDITIYESEQDDLKLFLEQQFSGINAKNNSDILNKQNAHNTYSLEQQLMSMVRKGDVSSIQKWVAEAPAVNSGILANEQLRQGKNTFVVSATLISRAAIQGGMDTEEAFGLSDTYIQQCERFNTLQQVTNLQYNMVIEFTKRMQQIRRGSNLTQLTIAVTNYIRHHLSEKIKAEDIAKAMFMSRPYLSAKFKEETGETLTDFILKEKTEEAKRLLRYSDKNFTAISSYLGFSSQSHFTRVFKKYIGMTPKEYRNKYNN